MRPIYVQPGNNFAHSKYLNIWSDPIFLGHGVTDFNPSDRDHTQKEKVVELYHRVGMFDKRRPVKSHSHTDNVHHGDVVLQISLQPQPQIQPQPQLHHAP